MPLHLAHFVRDVYSKARNRTEMGTVKFDEIAFRIESNIVCGYIQFRVGRLYDVWGWVQEYSSNWLFGADGPVFFETTSHVVGHHTIKVWQALITPAVECVFVVVPIQCF